MWRSPAGQPAWARPALLVVAALAALAYSWQVGSTIEIFYAAAVRSMTQSWHNVLFGAFDPAGTITVDKLPGALWVQALSARLFGFHVWSLMLPQAVEGVLTVLVLYRAVRRLAGPLAGLTASVVVAASPATMTLNRGNIPDSLMILLLVLAADSTVTAIVGGRWRSVVMVGVWVGLAFQAKMLEAWVVLPALGLAYLVAAGGTTRARVGRLVAIGAVTAVVSLSYMTFVSLTPASQRPYVDGSTSNSIYQQVFDYNGFSRVGQASPNQLLGRTLGTPLFTQAEPPPAWNRLLTRSYGRDTGWLLPAAVVAAAAVLVARRRKPRTDLPRAGALLWGTWLLVLAVLFSVSTTMNSYYAGALSPAVAGLLGIGSALAWERRGEARVAVVTAGTVLITVGYATWLLPTGGTGLPTGLGAAAIVLGLVAALALMWSALRQRRRTGPAPEAAIAVALAGAALLLVPAVASASVVAQGLGPFDTPFQSAGVTRFVHTVFAPQPSPPALADIEAARRGAPFLMAAQTSAVAAPYIYATGEEVLPLGGYTGTIPTPTTAATQAMVAAGDFHLALVASPGATQSALFIARHCLRVAPSGNNASVAPRLRIYFCTRSSG
ncbi:MAG: glycosyltransferase family 39 protein [Acidimicrobiales bacterium]